MHYVIQSVAIEVPVFPALLERLRLTTSTANVYGKATRTRTRNRRRFLVKIVWATCRPYGVFKLKITINPRLFSQNEW